jgi:hypothetical protein
MHTQVQQNTPWLGGPDPYFDVTDTGSYILSGTTVCSVWVDKTLDTAYVPDSLFCRVMKHCSTTVRTSAGTSISGVWPAAMQFDTTRAFTDSAFITRYYAQRADGVYQRAYTDTAGVVYEVGERSLALPLENGWFITGRPWECTRLVRNPVTENGYRSGFGAIRLTWSRGYVDCSPAHAIIIYEFSKLLGDDNAYKFLSFTQYYQISGRIRLHGQQVDVSGSIRVVYLRGAYSYAALIFEYTRQDILCLSYADGTSVRKKEQAVLHRRKGTTRVENIIIDEYYDE